MLNRIRRFFAAGEMFPKDLTAGEIPSSKEAYSTFLKIALPSVCEMVLMSLIGLIDTAMVSTIGTDAVAAVGLVNQPRLLFLCPFIALNVGVIAIVARRKGEGRQADANLTLRNAICIAIVLSGILMAVAQTFVTPLMRFAEAVEGETLEDASLYFRTIMWALPFTALSLCICAAQRGVGNTKLTMYVNITSNLVNVVFNWLLINGNLGFPKLGVRGAALATALGFVVGFVLSVLSLFRSGHGFLGISIREKRWLDKGVMRDIFKISKSSLLEQVCIRMGFFLYVKTVASLGTDAIAAHQIAMQFLIISFNFGEGIGIAGTSLVGQMLGKKRVDLAHMYGKLGGRLALITAIALAICVALLRAPLVSLFIHTSDAEIVRHWAQNLLLMVALFQPFQMSGVVYSGALRGAGDTKYVAKAMVLTATIMRPILSYIAVYVLGTRMGLTEYALMGAWVACLFDMMTRMTLMLRRYNGGKWHAIKV